MLLPVYVHLSVSSHGPFPVQFWHWSQIDVNMRLCLSGLTDVDRYLSHNVILTSERFLFPILITVALQ